MRRVLLTLAVAIAAALSPIAATAQGLLLLGVGNFKASGGGGAFSGPGDVVGGAQAFYGLRGYTAAKATANIKAVGLIRASDSHTCDVLLNGTTGGLGVTGNCSTGGENGTAWATWCTSTTCKATALYDQVSTINAVQATGTAQPVLTPNCIGTLPCLTFSGAQTLNAAGSASNQPLTISTVVVRTGAFTAQGDIFSDDPGLAVVAFDSSAATVAEYFGSFATVSATDGGWHAMQFVVNGSSSAFVIDATQTTGQNFGASALGANYRIGSESGGSFLTGNVTEVALYPFAFTTGGSSQVVSLCHNQFTYYGTSTSC